MKRYEAYRSAAKTSKITYFDGGSVVARNTGLTVGDMVATILSGNAVSVNSQLFSNNRLAYQISFDNPGRAVVRVTTSFTGSEETLTKDYRYTTLDNSFSTLGYS